MRVTGLVIDRRVLGLVLLFLGMFVVPSLTGVGPLSVEQGAQYVVNSVSFDPATKSFFGEVTVLGGTSGVSSEAVQFVLSDAERDAKKVDSDPFYLYASLVKQELLLPYRMRSYVDDWQCFSFDVSGSAGRLGGSNDVLRVLKPVVDKYRSYFDDASVYLTDVSFTGLPVVGQQVHVSGYVCGVRRSVAAYLVRTPDQQVYAEVNVFLRNSRGEVTRPVTVTSALGSTASLDLVSDGNKIGTVTFIGVERGTNFDLLFRRFPFALLVPYKLKEGSFSVSDADHPLSYYQSQASSLSAAYDQLKNFHYSDGTFNSPERSAEDLSSYLTSELGLPVKVFSYGGSELYSGYRGFVSSAQSYHNTLFSDLSDVLTGFVVDKNRVPPDEIVLRRDVSGISAYAYRLRFTVSASFVGIKLVSPRPKIQSVSVGRCSDLGCVVAVSIRNQSKYGGMVTVSVSSSYFEPASVSLYLPPLGSKDVNVFLLPREKISSVVSDTLHVSVVSHHWLRNFSDVRSVSVTVKPSKTCVFTEPVCAFDESLGVWKVLKCSSPYAVEPSVTYCAKGQYCSSGQCVDDVVLSVSCVSPEKYRVLYKYGGEKYFSCEQGYMCSPELAESGKIPPCKKSEGFVRPPSDRIHYDRSVVAVREYAPDWKSLSRALIVGGLWMVMPWGSVR